MKNLSLILILLINCIHANAQTGIGTIAPDSSAILDLTATNKGLLLPRIALTAANVWSLTGLRPTDGMMIFNTAIAGSDANAVTPGLYYWRGNQWYAAYQVTGPQYTGTGTTYCDQTGGGMLPQTTGFTNGQSYTGAVTTYVSAANSGTYPGDVVTVNGITLSRPSGSLATSDYILYNLSGTWTGVTGTFASFPLNFFNKYCNVTLPIAPATYAAGTLDCTGVLGDSMQLGVPATLANYKEVQITQTNGGAHFIRTAAVNGIVFTSSGTNNGFGTSLDRMQLFASGTPLSAGTFNYTVSLAGQTCSFPITFKPEADVSCADVFQNNTFPILTNNTPYAGTVTWSYTNGNGSTAVPAMTIGPVNGLTLVRNATTIASGNGSVTFTLSGTYTGATGGVVSFPISLAGTNCFAVYGDRIHDALNAGGCASCAAYDAVAANTWVKVTPNEYEALKVQLASNTVAGSATMPLITTGATTGLSLTGATNAPTNAKIPAQSYVAGFEVIDPGNAQLLATYTRVQPAVKYSASFTTGYVTYGGNLPNQTISGIYPSFSNFVIKTPTTRTSTLPSFLGYYDGGTSPPFATGETGYASATGNGNTGTLNLAATTVWWRIQAVTTMVKQW